jgi:hypothetical protein
LTVEEPEIAAGRCRAGDWSRLVPGTQLTVVKQAPDGTEAARYPAEVVAVVHDSQWVIVRATWTLRSLDIDGLTFREGDQLLEWFSPDHPFNAFAIYGPDERLKGWYANVSEPARLDDCDDPPLLIWRDLFLDLIALPDGTFTLRDQDDLAASGLDTVDLRLHRRVVAAGQELVRRFQDRVPPFTVVSLRIEK